MNRLKPGIIMCREKQDVTTANLLEKIVADEELHIDYLETQLELMVKLGEELYSAQCVSRPRGHSHHSAGHALLMTRAQAEASRPPGVPSRHEPNRNIP